MYHRDQREFPATALKAAGVAAIFTPGTSTQAIVDWIERELRPRVRGAAA